MTKQEYLASLERLMGGLDAQERQAQLDYYSEMFDDMLEDGLSADEAAARLEAARREAGEPEPERLPEEPTAEGKRTNKRRWRKILIWVLVVVVLVPVVMILSRVIRGMARSASIVGDAVEAVVTAVWDDREWNSGFQSDGFYTVDPAAVEVDSLDISWTSGNVKVTSWDQDYIGFGEGPQDAEYALCWCVDDGVLYIQDYRTTQLDLGLLEPKSLTVQLPGALASSLSEFSFDGVSADLTAEWLYADNFEAETGSGAVWADINCQNAELDSVSGDLYFSGAPDSIVANTSSGRITIEIDEGLEAMKVETRSVAGAMNVSGAVVNLEAHTTSGRVSLAVEGVTDLRVDTVSGDVGLALPEDFRAVVEFGTVSGDVENQLPQVAVNPKGEQRQEWLGEIALLVSTTSGDLTITEK